MPRLRWAGGLACLLACVIVGQAAAQDIFWESPRALTTTNARFVQTAVNGGHAALAWQEFVDGAVYLSLASTTDFRTYTRSDRFFGPVPYSEKEVPIFSLALTGRGHIYCVVLTGATTFVVLGSRDGGLTFRPAGPELASPSTSVAPYLSVTAADTLLLFVTQTGAAVTESDTGEAPIDPQPVATVWSRSTDGLTWSPFRPLAAESGIGTNLKPFHVSWRGTEYVVFQAVDSRYELGFYHLFTKLSTDGGVSWSTALPLVFREFAGGSVQGEGAFDNQRPHLAPVGDRLGLAWERRLGITGTSQVYYTELDTAGGATVSELTGGPASGNRYRASNPQIVVYRDAPYLLWFDNRAEEGRIILAERGDLRWFETDLTAGTRGANLFGRPVVLEDRLYVVWDNSLGDRRAIQLLEPDRSVAPPVLRAVDFVPNRGESRSRVTVRWDSPPDASGIVGYATAWDRDPDGRPDPVLSVPGVQGTATLSVEQDGAWYIHVLAADRAGNWSEPATMVFLRDNTPPPPVTMALPETDERGYLVSNTYRLSWTLEGEDAAGYSYSVDYLGPPGITVSAETVRTTAPPRRILTRDTALQRVNDDDGVWAVSVSAIDAAGNMATPATLLYRLDKYVPVTFISNVAATFDRFGATRLSLFGRGFAQGGLVSALYLDRDGVAPYDYAYDLEAGLYTVANDRLIDTANLPNPDAGAYRVGVVHPGRGTAWAPNTVTFVDRGTVKIGEYSYSFLPAWQRQKPRTFVNASSVLVWLLVLFLGLLALASARRLALLAGEGRMLREEVRAVIEGRGATVKKKQEVLKVAIRRGMGLRLKFTLLMMVLVILIVLMLSIPLAATMIQTQRQTLLEGLQNRIGLLSSSIAQAAEQPLKDALEGLGGLSLSADLPQQMDQMPEATYVVITGPGERVDDRSAIDYVWGHRGTPALEDLLDPGADPGALGDVRMRQDAIQALAETLRAEVDGAARTELGGLRTENAELVKELAGADPAGQETLAAAIAQNGRDIAARLLRYKTESITGSPPFDVTAEIQDTYVFVKPIIYTTESDDRYVRGYVRLGISTAMIRDEIEVALSRLIATTGFIALAALGLGVLGAVILASMTVAPIKKLAAGVAVIRDTEDKEQLADHRIRVRTRDEIGVLAQTVNEMTQGLVVAATASKDLTVGQETQKMFITLDTGPDGTKGNSGGLDAPSLEVFGFYEGARTVSGDYFEYVKLDEKHYALMKCDVAGKGVPAALVMVEVATLFSAFTRKWVQTPEKFRLDRFVYDVNDMLEVRGFKGRFAAFLVAIMDVDTGVTHICNAGDKILHWFDGAERKMKSLELPSSPASGVFPSSLVELQSGFQQVQHVFRKGDVLVLHTDGVEEDHRTLRDMDGNVRSYDEPDLEAERRHSFKPKKGEQSEMIETERLFGILDAALNRSTYVMTKFYNPNPGEVFTFDFTQGKGSLREAVYAVMGMDRMFRIYRDSTTDEGSRIRIDRNVLEVLRKHYAEFDTYFDHPVDDDGKSPQVTFSHLAEDEQFDDLTLLMVRRK